MPEMPDFDEIMKMALNAQAELQKAQDNLDKIEVEGAAGGGMVTVTMTAKGVLKAVKIDPSLMVADEREILEDLIVAASSDARSRADRVMQERMAEITKGLPIPPGMKLF
jgi:DNA-binding YbaB/EbfC family protein